MERSWRSCNFSKVSGNYRAALNHFSRLIVISSSRFYATFPAIDLLFSFTPSKAWKKKEGEEKGKEKKWDKPIRFVRWRGSNIGCRGFSARNRSIPAAFNEAMPMAFPVIPNIYGESRAKWNLSCQTIPRFYSFTLNVEDSWKKILDSGEKIDARIVSTCT